MVFRYIEILKLNNNTNLRTSGRLVAAPSLEACKNRPKHYMDKRTGHYYFYSGKSHHGALKVRPL